ncbi:hypothetical protein [Fontivita pretiosa]|uniref:hypothetical protein n=1 Tax=Fontivita pretiosa TaxID=2989684 RepID=UPI003D1854BA
MTLVLLALATLALSGTVCQSLRRAAEARAAQRQLQRSWGTLSCQRTLLPLTEQILAAAESGARWTGQAPVSVRRSVQLGELRFELIFADEQAKANAGALVQRRGKDESQRLLHALLAGSPMAARLQLRPLQPLRDPAPSPLLALIGSFGQVVDAADPALLLEDNPPTPSVADQLSCWGDGRLNWRRASPEVMRILLCPPLDLGQVQQLIRLRTTELDPDQAERTRARVTLVSALDQLQLSQSQRAFAQAWLREGSGCHSLWIIARSPRRSWYRLAVAPAAGGHRQAEVFEW